MKRISSLTGAALMAACIFASELTACAQQTITVGSKTVTVIPNRPHKPVTGIPVQECKDGQSVPISWDFGRASTVKLSALVQVCLVYKTAVTPIASIATDNLNLEKGDLDWIVRWIGFKANSGETNLIRVTWNNLQTGYVQASIDSDPFLVTYKGPTRKIVASVQNLNATGSDGSSLFRISWADQGLPVGAKILVTLEAPPGSGDVANQTIALRANTGGFLYPYPANTYDPRLTLVRIWWQNEYGYWTTPSDAVPLF